MKNLTPQTPIMNPGSSNNALVEKITGIPQNTDGRHPINIFEDNVVLAKMEGATDGWPLPHVATTKDVIRYYNKDSWDSFEKVGFFTYKGVLVCEEGKEEEIKRKLNRSTDIMPQVVAEPGTHKPSETSK